MEEVGGLNKIQTAPRKSETSRQAKHSEDFRVRDAASN